MDVRVGLWRKLSAKELMLLNCDVVEDAWESLGLHGFQPVHSEGDQPWVLVGRNDAKAETPVLWPPHAKRWLIGKDSDAGRDWGQEERGMTEDEMAGWHHWLDGREFEWTPGDGDAGIQGGLACCDSWGRKESDTTEWLNWTELIHVQSKSKQFLTEYSSESSMHKVPVLSVYWFYNIHPVHNFIIDLLPNSSQIKILIEKLLNKNPGKGFKFESFWKEIGSLL